ncbi:MAG: NAD(P)-binding protein, partial [Betaproteobacteria bacterium]|nr:NAD(P)-binding protein [Betaproteobacteria bacterium]
MSGSVVVIGAGVNELVAAHYLARAGHRVLVLEERAATDDIAFEVGWIPPQIVRELALERRGLTIQHPDPWAAAALPDGGRLELWHDMARSVEAIRRLSPRDAGKWPAFCERMAPLARLLETLYTAPALDLMTRDLGELAQLAGFAFGVRRLGRQGIEDLLRLMPMPVA